MLADSSELEMTTMMYCHVYCLVVGTENQN